METKLFNAQQLDQVAQLLKEGNVVAFPTETVYGLGAIATSQEAVQKVYRAKQRPSDNPLIVHVASIDDVKQAVQDFPHEAEQLVEAFWPGPLTIVLRARPGIVAPAVSAGLETVSFRMPNHPMALELIAKTGIPLVGPSANKSGRPSPTTSMHVLEDMDGEIAGICEGGACQVGIESTVVDLSNPEGVVVLRPGLITNEQIEAVIKQPLMTHVKNQIGEKEIPKSPGMKYRHYAPSAQVIAVEPDTGKWQQLIEHEQQQGKSVGVMANQTLLESITLPTVYRYSMGELGDQHAMLQRLFDGFRTLDRQGVDVIFVETLPEEGVGVAYMNRLKKATSRK